MLALSLLFAAFAVAAPGSFSVVHEKRDFSSPRHLAVRGERVDRDAILPVRIALRQSNLDDGYEYLMSVSDPSSADYGKHWTIEEIHAKFAPSDETVEVVTAWLESFGIHKDDIKESTSRGWLGVDIPVADAERMFETEYYEHPTSDDKVNVGCDKYHVPSHLSHHIDYVTPGIHVSSFAKRTVGRRALPQSELEARAAYNYQSVANCGSIIRPSCIKALYNIPDATSKQPENVLGIYEQGGAYDQTDLNLWFARYAPYVPQNTGPKLVSINNASAPVSVKNGQGESILDFDLAYSLIYPQKITLYEAQPTVKQAERWYSTVPGSKTNKFDAVSSREVFELLLDAVDGSFCTKADKADGVDCGTTELTRVLSVSYAASELFLPEKRTSRACTEYMKLGLKGHTLMFASGDYGPATAEGCINPAHIDDINDYNGTTFNPFFPASCPYITAVGATQLDHDQTVNGSETTMYQPTLSAGNPPYSIFGSSGGFSNYFTAPGYQKDALNTYFNNYDPGYPSYVYSGKGSVGKNGGKYAKGGRGIPDVSANGAKLAVFSNGELGSNFGTSLATPIWASMITLINEERTKAGKGPVGFINPVLYKNADIFNDITTGYAAGCLTRGYSAEPGWDPTTGLGTPNYPSLLKVFMDLP